MFLFLITLGAGLIRAWSGKLIGIALACIVVFTVIGAVRLSKRAEKDADRARVAMAHAQIQGFMGALGAYKMDNGNFPTTEQGLQALRVKPPYATQWNGPYMLSEIPIDP
jgi:general secretion pathway protein G